MVLLWSRARTPSIAALATRSSEVLEVLAPARQRIDGPLSRNVRRGAHTPQQMGSGLRRVTHAGGLHTPDGVDGGSVTRRPAIAIAPAFSRYNRSSVEKTFYIETFGCQMNAHDSEKVVGTLLAQGIAGRNPRRSRAGFYNTCSIRDKAEQKVFNRLQQFKKDGKGKDVRGAGLRRPAGRREDLRKAPHVSLVCGSASYNRASASFWFSSKPATAASPD